MSVRFRPLSGWDGPRTKVRRANPFRAKFTSTLEMLTKELDHLDARDIVIEAGFREQDIRLDGWPRANSPQPSDPAVRIAFESKFGPLIYQGDSCERWQDNVRSIALSLEALRAVERYGATKRGQQYTGWKAIEASASAMTDTLARSIVMVMSGLPESEPLSAHVKAALRRSHPDMPGGSEEAFQRLQAALEVIQ